MDDEMEMLLQSPTELHAAALAAYRANDFEKAVPLLLHLRERFGNDLDKIHEVDWNLAVCYSWLNDHANCLRWLEHFLLGAYEDRSQLEFINSSYGTNYPFLLYYAAANGHPLPPPH